MEKYRGSVLLRVLIFLGIIFFGVNSVFFYINDQNFIMRLTLFIGLFIQLSLGVTVLLLRTEKKAYQFFIALIFVGWSILNFLIAFVLPYSVSVWWPMYLIFVSIFLLVSGLKKYKKLKLGYVMPVLTLLSMGILFSLFSFDIVKVPFKTVAIIVGPILAVLCGLALVLFFLLQQRYKEFVIKDEDSGDFGDEELSFPKLD